MCDTDLIPLITLIIIVVTSIIIPLLNKLRKLYIKWRRDNRGLCVNCGVDSLRVYKEGHYFCDTCRKAQRIRKTRIWICPLCAFPNKVFPNKKTGDKICTQCDSPYTDFIPSSEK